MKEKFQTRIQGTSIGNFSDWENLFRVFGIRRCHPLFQEMGLPITVISKPEGIVKASHYFWEMRLQGVTWKGQSVGKGHSDSNFLENYRQEVLSLLNNTLSIIANSYNGSDVRELYDWSQRHFLDKKMIDCWYTWSLLLPGICDIPRKSFAITFHEEDIKGTADRYFGVEIERRISATLQTAREIPLSTLEQHMVQMEVTGPLDIPEVDVVEITEQVIRNQCAYQFWNEIRNWISTSEEELLLRWGYKEARALNIPVEDVVLPEKEV